MTEETLPPCDYRLTISSDAHHYYCRHSSVHAREHLVPASLCRSCPVREQPCSEARPVPADAQLHQLPSKLCRARSFIGSMAAFAKDGFRLVDDAEYQRRLEICEACDFFREYRCMKCGCQLRAKARGRAFRCPLGEWREPVGN